MAKKLSNATMVQAVYYQVGKSNRGEDLFKTAPFEVVLIDGLVHIRPWIGGMTDAALGLLGADSSEDKGMWRMDIGYESVVPIILNESQVGDGSDSWIGLHQISNI